jgi:ParB family transcriptional regulator, chromosome partitioning protein
MTKTARHITLSPSRDIPFDKLMLSQSNVRKIKAGISVEELAEDIARRGLLQGLNVRPVLDEAGVETGMFEIPAGGRRYQALALLVKQKRLAKTAPVPCVVRDPHSAIMAEDDSLAENVQRVALHPLDQFRAFVSLREKGLTEDEIAAAFFVAPQVVKQRLRLAAVASVLLEVYAEEGMTLEQLMAFTVNPDHARQTQVWEAIKNSWSKEPYLIRRMLTETAIRASDRRAAFVGMVAYEAAGGQVLRDLFQGDEGGWLQDPALLDCLVAEKLQAEAETIAAEGWKWIEVLVDLPYGFGLGMRRLTGTLAELSPENQAKLEVLKGEQEQLEAEFEGAEELPDEIDARLGALETQIESLENQPTIYDAAEITCAGVFLSLDRDGQLSVQRGFVRAVDEIAALTGDEDDDVPGSVGQGGQTGADPTTHRTVITVGGQPVVVGGGGEEDEDGLLKPLPERLVTELTAHRTLALREAVGNHPHVALTLLLHKLVTDTFRSVSASGGCLEARIGQVYFGVQATDLKESASAKMVDARHEHWEAALPFSDDDALWDHLDALGDAARLALLAHCVSFGINALQERPNTFCGNGVSAHGLARRMAQADRVARETGLDMVEVGWVPTVGNYLGRVPKVRILEAVREAKGEGTAQLIDHLKKGDMAKEAERLLAGSGWLPQPLRLADLSGADADYGAADVADLGDPEPEMVDLPDFLSGDDAAKGDLDADQMMAAE